jgi:hypothetical protein
MSALRRNVDEQIADRQNVDFLHGFMDKKLPYDGQDKSRDLGGSSPVQEDGNWGKGW